MTDTPWGWKTQVDTIDTFEMVRTVDDDPSSIVIEFVQGHPVMRTGGIFCELGAIEFSVSIWRSRDRKPKYIQLMDKWRAEGSFDRIDSAIETRAEVRIKRSSGEWQPCVIASCAGHGGLSCSVEWLDDAAPEGKLFKAVDTEDLLAWNPGLGGA